MNYKVATFLIWSPQVPKARNINLCLAVDLVITVIEVPSH